MAETSNQYAQLISFTDDTAEFRLLTGDTAKVVFTGPDDHRIAQLDSLTFRGVAEGLGVVLQIGAFGAVYNIW